MTPPFALLVRLVDLELGSHRVGFRRLWILAFVFFALVVLPIVTVIPVTIPVGYGMLVRRSVAGLTVLLEGSVGCGG